jgi:SNW domain-containing protein 1
MQQLLAQKEKAQKEENLRMLAQRAREEATDLTVIVEARMRIVRTRLRSGRGRRCERRSVARGRRR